MRRAMSKEKVRIDVPGNRKYYKIRPPNKKRSKKSKDGHIVSDQTAQLFHEISGH
jgi:hypothetical protein